MVKYLADQNRLVFYYEPDTYSTGSNVGTPQWIGLVQDASHDETTNNISIRYQGSTDRNVDTFANGPIDYTGTFTYFPQDWKFLAFAVGQVDSGALATAGSHMITETNSDDIIYAGSTNSLLSFTLEDSKNLATGSNFIRTFGGCIVNTFGATFTQGAPVSCEVGYTVQTGRLCSGSITAATATTTRPYMWSDSQLQIPSGTTYDNVTDFTFNVNNNLEGQHYVNGSREIKSPLPLNRDYELTATFVADDGNARTLYNHYISGTTFNSMIQSIGNAGSIFLVMSGCKVTDMDVPSPVEGMTEQTATIVPQHVAAKVVDDINLYDAR